MDNKPTGDAAVAAASPGLELKPTEDHGQTASSGMPWPNARYAWYVVGVLSLAYVLGFIDRISIGLLAMSIQADLGLSDTQISLLQGVAFAIFYVTFGLPCGWLADHFSRRNLLVAGIAIWSLMTSLCGLVTSFTWLFLARIGVGLGEATLSPAASSLIADYFPPAERGKAYGAYQIALALGGAIGWLAGGALLGWLNTYTEIVIPIVGVLKPWQATLLGVGLPGIFVSLAILLTVREPIRRNKIAIEGATSWRAVAAFYKQNRSTYICHHFGLALLLLPILGWMAWLPTLFGRVYDWPVSVSTPWFALAVGLTGTISGATCGVFISALARRGYTDAALRTCIITGIGVTAFSAMAFVMPSPWFSLGMLSLSSLFLCALTGAATTSANEITPNEMRSKVMAIYLMVLGIVSAGGPLFIALLTEHLFRDPLAIGLSMTIVVSVFGMAGLVLLWAGLEPYRISVSRTVAWRYQ